MAHTELPELEGHERIGLWTQVVGDSKLCHHCGTDANLTRTIRYTVGAPGPYNVEPHWICDQCKPGHERDLRITRRFRED